MTKGAIEIRNSVSVNEISSVPPKAIYQLDLLYDYFALESEPEMSAHKADVGPQRNL